MELESLYKLDNPVWFALNETHQSIAINYSDSKFYQPEFCPFGTFNKLPAEDTSLVNYSQHSKDFYVVGALPAVHTMKVNYNLVCVQMLLSRPFVNHNKNEVIPLLCFILN